MNYLLDPSQFSKRSSMGFSDVHGVAQSKNCNREDARGTRRQDDISVCFTQRMSRTGSRNWYMQASQCASAIVNIRH